MDRHSLTIRYTLDDGWYDADEYSEGQNLSTPTLDVVMAHEIGHTALGRAALGLTNIDSSRSNGKYNIGAIKTWTGTMNLEPLDTMAAALKKKLAEIKSDVNISTDRALGDNKVVSAVAFNSPEQKADYEDFVDSKGMLIESKRQGFLDKIQLEQPELALTLMGVNTGFDKGKYGQAQPKNITQKVTKATLFSFKTIVF